jgi:hypothetical protein
MILYLTSSELYKNLLKYSHNKNKIKEEFNKKIKELNYVDENEVNYFLSHYKSISYDKTNIIKYIKLLNYFKYTITENIIKYIFKKYFFDVIDNIIDNDAIEMIKKISLIWEFKYIIDEYYEIINKKVKSWTQTKLYNFS